MHDSERKIIEFLHHVSEAPGYDRRVILRGAFAGRGLKAWRFTPVAVGAVEGNTIDPLFFDVEDLASLRERGYVEGADPRGSGSTQRYALTQKGRDLRARGYIEVADPPPGQHQHNYISGGNVAIAQTSAGNISQVVGPSVDLAPVLALLVDLRETLTTSSMPAEDRDEYRTTIERLETALVEQAPRLGVIARLWAVIATIGTGESFLQAGERSIAIVHDLAPHMQALLSR